MLYLLIVDSKGVITTTNRIGSHKRWTFDDFKTVIDLTKSGRQKRLIAHEVGRTVKAVHIVVTTWRSVVEGKNVPSYNPSFVRMARAYQTGNTSFVHTTSPNGHTTEVKYEPFEKVGKLFDDLQTAIVEAVEYGAKLKAEQLTAEEKAELIRLRRLEEEAKKSNIIGLLRSKFQVKA